MTRSRSMATPARAETLDVCGLAVTRRVRPDIDPGTPLVVLVHGAMDRAASFGRTMRRLSELEVVTYDRRGYGASTRQDRDNGTVASHSKDLVDVIDFARVTSPVPANRDHVVVVGHSLGGLIALRVAVTHPNLLSGVGAYESPAPWLDNSFDSVGGGAVDVADTDGNEHAALFFYEMMIGSATFSRLRERDITARISEGDALVAELRSLRDPGQAFDLSVVNRPVIIGTGTQSSAAMTKNSDQMARAMPNATRVWIDGAAHGAHLTRPEGYADYVRECVAQAEVD